ncbi:MAG TPA: hypothetical protein VLV15_17565, partial [Dongiaceae bacterium]|nr:hypothetical protein [Dongiaceae bacterium]
PDSARRFRASASARPRRGSRAWLVFGAWFAPLRAVGVFQLDFSDLDISGYPPPISPILPLFTSLGLVDVNLNPKPALTAWDATFARPRR